MKKSIIKKYRFYCMLSGIVMGCIFPMFTRFFMIPKSDLYSNIFTFACVFAGITVGLMSFMIGNYTVVKTFLRFNKSFSRMSNGDFTHNCTIESDDEMGEIVYSLGVMKESLKALISTVKEQVISIDDIAVQYKVVLVDHVIQVEEVLKSAEEVSTDMIKITNASIDLDNSFHDINIAVKTISEKANEGTFKAEEIFNKAYTAKTEIRESVKKTDRILDETNAKLQLAIENVKVIDEINNLLKDIMRISNQTNLLALNASIEASHADISGKGFSVIASEIKRLSDDSNKNTKQITLVMNKVNSSVEELLTYVKSLLEYIDTFIRKDYIDFEKIVAEYENNSHYIKEMVTDFSNQSEEVFAKTREATDRIGDISTLSQNSRMNADSILEEVKLLVEESTTLSKETNKLSDNSQTLKNMLNKFKLQR